MKTAPEPRISSAFRGVIIGALALAFGSFSHLPGASFSVSLLIAVGLQLVVLLLRRFVPPEHLPEAMGIYEMIADGVTVFLFALGVFGGIQSFSQAA